MLEVTAHTDGSMRTTATDGTNTVVMDEPLDLGGTNEGLTPLRTLAAALAGCTAITLKLYTARKGWPLEDVDVHVHLEPAAVGTKDSVPMITQTVTLKGALDDQQRARLQQISGRCPVHRIMEGRATFEELLTEAGA